MTQDSTRNYNNKRQAAEQAIQHANSVINNGDATSQQINDAKNTVEQAQRDYVEAKSNLRADKSQLQSAYDTLNRDVLTNDKKPASVRRYNEAISNIRSELDTAKADASSTLRNTNPSVEQVRDALNKINTVQPKVNQAIALLQPKENNSELVQAKKRLQDAVNDIPQTQGMTQQTINNYNDKQREAERALTSAQRVIDNGDATTQEITSEKSKVEQAMQALTNAKSNLRADKNELQTTYNKLIENVSTNGKKPASIRQYETAKARIQNQLNDAKNEAERILGNDNPQVSQVTQALNKIKAIQPKLTEAINMLQNKENNTELVNAKNRLENAVNDTDPTHGMTQETINNYNAKKREAQNEIQKANMIINNGDATAQDISSEKSKVEQVLQALQNAKNDLRADKRELQTAYNKLIQNVNTNGKKPSSIQNYKSARRNIENQYNTAKDEAHNVLENTNPTVNTVEDALRKINAIQPEVTKAINILQDKEDNSELVRAKEKLDQAINSQPSLNGMTQESINNYTTKRREAQNIASSADTIINNGDASIEQITENKIRVEEATNALNEAKQHLTADTTSLKTEVRKLSMRGDTNNKKPSSVSVYNNTIHSLQSEITQTENRANTIINKPIRSVEEVNNALHEVNQLNQRLTDTINLLQPLANKESLKEARNRLESKINETVQTDGMTQQSVENYKQAKIKAQNESSIAQTLINNGDASDQEVSTEIEKLNQKLSELTNSINHLTVNKEPLETAKNQLQANIDQKPSTDGMTQQSVQSYQRKLQEAKDKINLINNVLANNPDVNAIRTNKVETEQINNELTQAKQGLTADKQPLINAKTALQQSLDNQPSTTGMTEVTIQNYNAKRQKAEQVIQNANKIIENAQPSVQQVSDEKSKVEQALSELNNAKSALRADKQELQQAYNQLIQPTDLNNKKPASITAYNQRYQQFSNELNSTKTNTDRILKEQNPSVADVNNALNKVREVQQKLNNARALLQNKEDNSALVRAKEQLQQAVDQVPSTEGMTQQTKDDYNSKQQAAQQEISKAQQVIDNGDADEQQITTETDRVNQQTTNLTQAINGLTVNKEPLETAKTALQNNIDQVPSTDGMTQQSVANYNQKLQIAKNEINTINNVLANNPDVNAIKTNKAEAERISNDLTQAKNNLQVDTQPLEKIKRQLQDEIDQGTNTDGMTQDSVDNYNDSLSAAIIEKGKVNKLLKRNPTVEQVKESVANAQQVIQDLQNTRTSLVPDKTQLQEAKNRLENSINQQTDTDGMTQDSLNNYNDKLAKARQNLEKISKVLGGQPTVAEIRQNTDEANAHKQALDTARSQLTLNREPYINHINNESHLNNAQKDNFKAQVNSAPNHNTLETIKNKADTLNQSMTALSESIADYENQKQQENYLDASNNKRQDYDNAVNAAKGILNQTQSPTMSADVINQKAEDVKRTKTALDGNQRLEAAKQQALNHLNTLNDLNNAQRQALTNAINHSPNINSVNQAKDKANTVNTAMTQLKQTIANYDDELHDGNYINADKDKQDAYNNAVNNAKQLINQSDTNQAQLDPAEINKVTQRVNTTKNDLNGNDKLVEAKSDANTTIDGLTYLNEAQRNKAKENVGKASTKTNIASQLQDYNQLNTAMQALRNSVNDVNNVKANSNYINEDNGPKEAYNQAVTHAQTLINAQSNPEMSRDVVNQKTQAVNTAHQNLHGQQKLEQAQSSANTEIGNLPNLTNTQKAKEKELVNSKQTRTEVQEQLNQAKSLDSSMGTLKSLVAKQPTVQKTSAYINEDQPEQSAYNNSITMGQTIINKKADPVLDKTLVDNAISNISTKENALHGEQKLTTAKTEAINALNTLADLNTPQKEAIKTAINTACSYKN